MGRNKNGQPFPWQTLLKIHKHIKLKTMFRTTSHTPTTLKVNKSIEGETIEQKVSRIINNGEPITDTVSTIYEERDQGVNPAHDIRTDRFEIAVEAMDKVHKSAQAKRDNVKKLSDDLQKQNDELRDKDANKGNDGKPESTPATD